MEDLLPIVTQTRSKLERCDWCGVLFVADYGYSLMTSWVVTGHSLIAGYSCEHDSVKKRGQQHWGCTPAHAMQATLACIQNDEHMSINNLIAKHAAIEGPRYSSEDAVWATNRGPDFHLIK